MLIGLTDIFAKHTRQKARKDELKKWEERLEKMNDYDKGYLITGIEDGWIDPNIDNWHIYCRLKGIDEHPILTWLKKIVGVFGRK